MSARGSEHDKVHTLGIGADDYLAKPFGMRELVARVQAALRRSGGIADERGAHRSRSRGCASSPTSGARSSHDGPARRWIDAALTPTEFRLLLALARERAAC